MKHPALALLLAPLSLLAVPQGAVTWHTLAPGKFYPGTPHHYAVYVPRQLDPAAPAPFMVFLDGTGAIERLHTPAVLDDLIARGDLPPLIGVFVDPGIQPALSGQVQSRYERIFEYDSLSDRFSRFLLEELLPEVARGHPLSDNPDAHAIEGVSTGAVGAFVAAWQRPDQFHRVLTFIGTYVDMKGAEELPSLVRKTEPKPIRIFMQDGRNDHIVPGQPWGTAFSGSWPINNQVMFEALKFAGYDVRLVMGQGKHDTQQAAEILPEALRWLWAGYPKPVEVHEPATMKMEGYDPRGRVYTIVSADHPWAAVGDRYESVSALAADPQGKLFVADPRTQSIWRIDPDGKSSLFRGHTPGVAALAFGPDGRLYASQPAQRRIVSYGPIGEQIVVSIGVEADALALTSSGGIYFLDRSQKSAGFIDLRRQERRPSSLEEMAEPSALALSPDQAMVVVADGQRRFSWSFQISSNGSLVNGEPFYRLYRPDSAPASGICAAATDAIGQSYFAGPLGIQVTEQNGRVAAILNGPHYRPVTAFTFAGPAREWLCASDGHRIYRRPTKIPGASPWSPNKPPAPPL